MADEAIVKSTEPQEKPCTFFKRSGRKKGAAGRKRKQHPSSDEGAAKCAVICVY